MQNQDQSLPIKRDAMEMWQDFCWYCKKARTRIVLFSNVPTEDAKRVLVNITSSKEDICPWVLKLPKPVHISTLPLRSSDVGIIGTPVYSYTVDFDAHNYYFAFFEKLPSLHRKEMSIVLKSIKLDEQDVRNHPHLCSQLASTKQVAN